MAWSSGYQLRVVEGKHKGLVIHLDQASLTLGRATTPGESAPGYIFFYEPTVSRVHAELRWNDKKKMYALHHKSNTNPTLVNGTPVDKRTARPLEPGTTIQMGLLVMEVEPAAQGRADAPPPREEPKVGPSVRPPEPESQPKTSVVGPILEALSSISKTARDRHEPNAPPPAPANAPQDGEYLERGFGDEGGPAVALGFRLVVAEGPDRGMSFPVSDTVLVLGRMGGADDPRKGQGILLSDGSVPKEAGMLVWQGREGTYGLVGVESNATPIRVRRVVSGSPKEVAVDVSRPIALQEGDVLLVGATVMVLRRGDAPPMPRAKPTEAKPTVAAAETLQTGAAEPPPAPKEKELFPKGPALPPWAEKPPQDSPSRGRWSPPPDDDEEGSDASAGGVVPKGFPGPRTTDKSMSATQISTVPRPRELDPSEVPTHSGMAAAVTVPPAPPGPVNDKDTQGLSTITKPPNLTVPTVTVGPSGQPEPKIADANVLAWPWRNQSDYVFDFLAGPNKGCQIALVHSELPDDRTITLGCPGPRGNDIVIDSPNVANTAATLRFRGGRFGLLNEGPDDSVLVNRTPLKRGDQVVLMTGDRIDVGDTIFRFLERRVVETLQGFQLQVESGVDQDQDRNFQFSKQRLLVGRGKSCDIQLNDLEVSRVHVALVHRDGKFFVQHRSETNPTFLNGVSLLPGAERLIQPGDRIRLSSLTLLQFAKAEPRRRTK